MDAEVWMLKSWDWSLAAEVLRPTSESRNLAVEFWQREVYLNFPNLFWNKSTFETYYCKLSDK